MRLHHFIFEKERMLLQDSLASPLMDPSSPKLAKHLTIWGRAAHQVKNIFKPTKHYGFEFAIDVDHEDRMIHNIEDSPRFDFNELQHPLK